MSPPAKRNPPPSKSRKPARQSPLKQRQKSEELGDDAFMVRYNSRTGRPIRTSAGKKSANPDYVNPDEAILQLTESPDDSLDGLDAVFGAGSDVEPDEDSDNEMPPKQKSTRKRARTPTPPPSPSPPPLSPSIHDEIEVSARARGEVELETDEESSGLPATEVSAEAGITLTFNIPPGFQGPLVVKLDTSSLSRPSRIAKRPAPVPSTGHASPKSKRICKFVGKPCEQSLPTNDEEVGFLDLAPELRNKIYRLLFVTEESLDFHSPSNFSRSG